MAESTPVDPNSPDGAVNHHEQPLAFLDTFDALRARPKRWLYQVLTRMERRATKRLPASRGGSGESHERGGIAEPPPVLDLVTTDTNRRELVGLLKRRSVLHPVWEPGGRPGAAAPLIAAGAGGPVEGATGRDAAGEDGAGTGVTTGELYELLERLSLGSDPPEDPPRADAGNQPPPPPPFRRLNSLLQLRECEVSNIHKGAVGGDDASKTPLLSHDRRTQFYVVAELRKVRFRRADTAARASRSAIQRSQDRGLPGTEGEDGAEPGGPGKGSPGSADSWITGLALRGGSALATAQAAAARLSAALAVRLANIGSFSLLDSIFLTPFAFVVTFLLSVGPLTVAHLLITQVDTWVTTAAAALVFLGLVIRPPMLHIPWLRYRWLDRHRYILDDVPEGQGAGHEPTNHRTRGIHVLNLLNQAGHAPGWIEPGDRRRPPNIHRLAVNAFLDDLHETYGSSRLRHQFGPRRKRGQRPVLIVDQARADRATTYLVRLIEDERLRRAFPDPLLVVQVRTADETPLLTGDAEEDRYLVLPEGREGRVGKPGETPTAAGGPELTPRAIALWRRRRYTSGVLGARRLLPQHVGPDAAQWRDNPGRPPYDWVLAPKPLAVVWSFTGVLVTTFSLVVGLGVGPWIVQRENDCVLKGMFPPAGIVRVNDECVGVTDGETTFHERLKLVTGLIREENEAIKDSEDYVTVVHVGELSRPNTESESLALAGVHGELHGIAEAQALHNRSAGPKVKVLLANTGHSWSGAEATASEITRLVEDESLGKDRPIGAVGFGHSVEANNEIIRALGDVHLPMVGTTATFDDIAFHHNEYPSYLFFPIAPSNTRLAQMSAFWAREGVSKNIETDDGEVRRHSLGPVGEAVAIANAEPGETYGTHLAEAFMAEFTRLGGTPWNGSQERPGTEPGVLFYQVEGAKGTGIRSRLEEVCADPPNLIYFAGRSTEFENLQTALREERRCQSAPITVLAGDDVAKYVTDNPDKIRQARHPVYYTPLAASGDWNQNTLQDEQGFYDEMSVVDRKHYDRDGDDPDARPSVAHAVIGYDAMRAVSRALELDFSAEAPDEEAASSPEPTPDPSSTQEFLDGEEAYERARAQFLSNLQADRWTGVSGYIQFGDTAKGNWSNDRMVQLVLAGPRDAQGHHQHVMAVCGRISEDRSGEEEDSVCPEEKGSDGETKTAEDG